MPNAKKTKAGTWKITIYDYKDSRGKIHQKTFTASSKREVDRLVREYKEGPKISDLTVGEAVASYIAIKEPALSPSTVRGYKQIERTQFASSRFGSNSVIKLDTIAVQRFVSDLVVAAGPEEAGAVYTLHGGDHQADRVD